MFKFTAVPTVAGVGLATSLPSSSTITGAVGGVRTVSTNSLAAPDAKLLPL